MMYGTKEDNARRFINPAQIFYIIIGVVVGAIFLYYISKYKIILYN
jgi:hypothetical protein